jgi:hypothetical protein
MIKSVLGFGLDCYFMYDGNLYQVESFPTRKMVFGNLIHKFMEPCAYQVKVPIQEVDQLDTMDWHIQEANEKRKEWLKGEDWLKPEFTSTVKEVIKKSEKIFPSVKEVVLKGYHETLD